MILLRLGVLNWLSWVRKIIIVSLFIKLIIIGCGIMWINLFNLNKFVVICSKFVRRIVVNKYCILWFVIKFIIIIVIVLVVLEIILGWLLKMEVIRLIINVV